MTFGQLEKQILLAQQRFDWGQYYLTLFCCRGGSCRIGTIKYGGLFDMISLPSTKYLSNNIFRLQ